MYNTEKLTEIVKQILQQIPRETIFNQHDALTLQQHQEILLGLGPELVAQFYVTLFNHAPTRDVFHENERETREKEFLKWWQRSIVGPFDAHYWAWQAFVGVIHVKREVSNSMMTSMWGWLLNYCSAYLQKNTSPELTGKIMHALQKLSSTSLSLAEDTFLRTYLRGILQATGFKQALLDRMVFNEIDAMVAEYKRG